MKNIIAVIDRGLTRPSHSRWCLSLFGFGLLFALLFVFFVFPLMSDATSGMDPDGYGRTGQNWYETGQFNSINKSPLYPLFIALISWLRGGYNLFAIQIGQAILFALTNVVLYEVFRLTLNDRVGRYGSLLCAVFPLSILYIPRLWTETFLTFTLALFVWALVLVLQRPTVLHSALCGVALGVVILSKGISVVFLPLTFVVFLIVLRRQNLIQSLSIVLAIALLFLGSWTWRNWQVAGEFLPTHANGGYNFYLGNGFTKYWLDAPLSYPDLKDLTEVDIVAVYESAGFQPKNDLEVDDVLREAALADLRERPLLGVQKLFVQSLTFWYLAGSSAKSLLTGGLQIPVLLLALPGIWAVWRDKSWGLVLIIPIGGIMGLSVLVFAFGRLAITIMPYLIGLMTYALLNGWGAPFFTPHEGS